MPPMVSSIIWASVSKPDTDVMYREYHTYICLVCVSNTICVNLMHILMSSTILFHISIFGKSMMERAGIASVASIKSVSSSKVSLGKAEVTGFPWIVYAGAHYDVENQQPHLCTARISISSTGSLFMCSTVWTPSE